MLNRLLKKTGLPSLKQCLLGDRSAWILPWRQLQQFPWQWIFWGIVLVALEKQLIRVEFVMLPWELGRSVMKFTAIWGHGLCRMWTGDDWAQTAKGLTIFSTSVNIDCHQNLFFDNLLVGWMLGWPELNEMCTHWLTSSPILCGTNSV